MLDAETPARTDRYCHGTIQCVLPGSRTGWLVTDTGRDVPFAARDMLLLGTAEGFPALRAGLRVGFDLGRTSRGLCVTTMRVYEAP